MHLEPGPELLVRSALDDTAVRRAHAGGDLVRVAPGRYVRADVWAGLDAAAREILRVVAVVSRLHFPAVVSHASAAALWRLPRLGSPRKLVDVIDRSIATTTSGTYVVRHASALPTGDVVDSSGVRVTTPTRTAVDLALTASFRQAVVSLDHGLRSGLFTPGDLAVGLSVHPALQRRARARRAIEFADGLANRPGESLSRVVMAESGFAAPELQRAFRSPFGAKADVDFFWPEVGVVGEFDGDVKYLDRTMRGGRSIEQVVIDEKNRENWIRALPEVRGFVRWTWSDVVTPGRLARMLSAAGVPLPGRSTFSRGK